MVAVDAKDIAGSAILPGRDLVALPSVLKMEIPLEPLASWPQASAADKVAQVKTFLLSSLPPLSPLDLHLLKGGGQFIKSSRLDEFSETFSIIYFF